MTGARCAKLVTPRGVGESVSRTSTVRQINVLATELVGMGYNGCRACHTLIGVMFLALGCTELPVESDQG